MGAGPQPARRKTGAQRWAHILGLGIYGCTLAMLATSVMRQTAPTRAIGPAHFAKQQAAVGGKLQGRVGERAQPGYSWADNTTATPSQPSFYRPAGRRAAQPFEADPAPPSPSSLQNSANLPSAQPPPNPSARVAPIRREQPQDVVPAPAAQPGGTTTRITRTAGAATVRPVTAADGRAGTTYPAATKYATPIIYATARWQDGTLIPLPDRNPTRGSVAKRRQKIARANLRDELLKPGLQTKRANLAKVDIAATAALPASRPSRLPASRPSRPPASRLESDFSRENTARYALGRAPLIVPETETAATTNTAAAIVQPVQQATPSIKVIPVRPPVALSHQQVPASQQARARPVRAVRTLIAPPDAPDAAAAAAARDARGTPNAKITTTTQRQLRLTNAAPPLPTLRHGSRHNSQQGTRAKPAKIKSRKPTRTAALNDPTKSAPAPGPDQWSPQQISTALAACKNILASIKIRAKPAAPIKKGRCGDPAPIIVSGIGANPVVKISPPATLNCAYAATLHRWVMTRLQPTARKLLGEPITRISTMSSYACRNRYGKKGGKLSEHAKANALDIGSFKTADNQTISVLKLWGATEATIASARAKAQMIARRRAAKARDTHLSAQGQSPRKASLKTSGLQRVASLASPTKPVLTTFKRGRLRRKNDSAATPQTKFLHRVHAQACGLFGTVLGPEANKAHANHFHFDAIKRRRRAFCE